MEIDQVLAAADRILSGRHGLHAAGADWNPQTRCWYVMVASNRARGLLLEGDLILDEDLRLVRDEVREDEDEGWWPPAEVV